MSEKRMLVVAGSFVPYNDPPTLLTYKRLKHLDMKMDVLTLGNKPDESIKRELENDESFKKFDIEEFSSYENTICIAHPLRLPLGLINMQRYIRKALKKSKEKHYDYLYTSSIPGISHICGLKIKEAHPEIKWYASFSDPIKNAPYKNDPNLEKRSIFYKIAFNVGSWAYMNDRYEEAAFKHADKLIFICEKQRDFMINQYPNREELLEKSIVLPLCYDKDWKMYKELTEVKEVHNTPKQAVHLGRLYGLRTIYTFLEALKELKEEDDKLSEKIVFHQYSEIQKEDVEYIRQNHLEDVFKIHDKVSYEESLRIMKEADILVLFDTIIKHGIQPYLPSKIVEYLMLRKDILGICGDNSPAYELLNEYGYETAGTGKEEIKKNILKLIKENKKHEYSLDRLESKKNSLRIDDEL